MADRPRSLLDGSPHSRIKQGSGAIGVLLWPDQIPVPNSFPGLPVSLLPSGICIPSGHITAGGPYEHLVGRGFRGNSHKMPPLLVGGHRSGWKATNVWEQYSGREERATVGSSPRFVPSTSLPSPPAGEKAQLRWAFSPLSFQCEAPKRGSQKWSVYSNQFSDRFSDQAADKSSSIICCIRSAAAGLQGLGLSPIRLDEQQKASISFAVQKGYFGLDRLV